MSTKTKLTYHIDQISSLLLIGATDRTVCAGFMLCFARWALDRCCEAVCIAVDSFVAHLLIRV